MDSTSAERLAKAVEETTEFLEDVRFALKGKKIAPDVTKRLGKLNEQLSRCAVDLLASIGIHEECGHSEMMLRHATSFCDQVEAAIKSHVEATNAELEQAYLETQGKSAHN